MDRFVHHRTFHPELQPVRCLAKLPLQLTKSGQGTVPFGGQPRAAAMGAAGGRDDQRRSGGLVDTLDQHPGMAIGHTHLLGRRAGVLW